jgi:hypothetical protein
MTQITQMTQRILAGAFLAASLSVVACGGSSTPAPAPAPAATPAPAAASAAKAAGALTLLEPAEGAFSGHVDMFRWSAADGADGYKLKVSTLSGRVVWESPVLTTTEAHLPATIALEPEAHTWQVTAMKGADTLATAAGRFTVTP